MRPRAKAHLKAVAPYQPGRPIEEVRRELGLRRVIKLASNENPYPPAPRVLEAMRKAAGRVNRYPDGGCRRLRAALAGALGVEGRRLVFGNGSDEILVMLLRAFAGPGDEVVTASPSFLVYSIAARTVGARVVSVPLKDFHYDLEGMRRAVGGRTRVVFIGNPDNPAGTYVTERALRAFLRSLPGEVIVCVDEAYWGYVQADDYPDTVRMGRRRPNLVTTRTFSKLYGLAGLRIGYGIGPPAVISALERVREPFNVNSVAQAAALACLQEEGYYRRIAEETERERRRLIERIAALGLRCVPTVTNFLLVEVGRRRGAVVRALLERGVIVRDMRFWGLDTYIRVTVGRPEENAWFLRSLAAVIEGMRRSREKQAS